MLINNAGIGPISPLDDLRVEEWEATIDVNVEGVLYGIAAALLVFRQQRFGHFVNTASTAAHRIVSNQAVYAATKTAVRVISEASRQEAGDKVGVTVITPGFTRSDFRSRCRRRRSRRARRPPRVALVRSCQLASPEGGEPMMSYLAICGCSTSVY